MFIKLHPVKPNQAEGAVYRRELDYLIGRMVRDLEYHIKQHYETHEHRITAIMKDASPTVAIKIVINKRMKIWQDLFKKLSRPLSKKFISNISNSVNRDLKLGAIKLPQDARKEWAVKVDKDSLDILNAKQSSIQANVDLITNIPVQYKERIQQNVNEAISRGRDWGGLADDLQKSGIITKNRAKTIARDQLNKATSTINNAKQMDLGIVYNEWQHSGGDKEPRASHLAASGKRFKLSKGCLIDGEYIYTGEKINCTCFSVPVIEI